MKNAPTIAVIAGEVSGDQLGGWLMQSIRAKEPKAQFIGLGGPNMEAQGLSSLFNYRDIALIGIVEVLPHARRILKRIREMVEYLEREKPGIIVTIDVPGFVLRVLKLMRKRGRIKPPVIHYVAPTVWAYRPERAKIVAERYDCLLCILPFEPPYFTKEGLRAEFIGHEIAWWWREKGDGAAFRKRNKIAKDTPLLAVFPGSRMGELKRLLPVFRDALKQLQRDIPNLEVALQVPPGLATECIRMTSDWTVPHFVVSDPKEKKDLFAAATAALAKSGTIGLECALAGLPSITTYKANPISVAFVRRIIKVPFVNLANVLLGREVIPELLQEKCTPQAISAALEPLLTSTAARDLQKQFLRVIPSMLGADDSRSPSDKGAEIVLSYLN